MNQRDYIYVYLLANKQVRAYFLVAPLMQQAVNLTAETPDKQQLLLTTLNITALMTALSKGQHRLSLRLRQPGGGNKLSTDGFSTGQLTGHLTTDHEPLTFKNGSLQIIQSDSFGHSYTSFVGMATGRLYDDFITYFATSTQTDTIFLPFEEVTGDANIVCLLQALPGCTVNQLHDTQQQVQQNREALTDCLSRPESASDITKLTALLPDSLFLTRQSIHYACGCSADLFSSLLYSLPQSELRTLIDTNESLTSHCSLCGKSYSFSPLELTTYLA